MLERIACREPTAWYKRAVPGVWLFALLTVLLESHPYDPALLGVALQSCGEALADAECRRAGEGGAPDFLARLTWRDELHARVEVRAASRADAPLDAREIAFTAADSPAERYRALGLVVAAYVLARRPEPAPAGPSELAPAPVSAVRAPARFALDLALLGGPALDRGGLRGGGLVRALARPFRALPALSLVLGARVSHRPDAPRLTWAGLSLGVAGRLRLLEALHAEARLEWVGQRLFASARAPESGAIDRGGRLRMGGQLGLELFYRASAHVLPFVGAELARLRPRVRLLVAGREVGEERAAEATLLVGTRIAW